VIVEERKERTVGSSETISMPESMSFFFSFFFELDAIEAADTKIACSLM